MPPKQPEKVANLVRLFEERTPGIATPSSHRQPSRHVPGRRVSLPAPNPAQSTQSPPRKVVVPRSSSLNTVAECSSSAVVQADASQATQDIPSIPKTAWKPQTLKPLRPQASPLHATNVKSADAAQAIANKLDSTRPAAAAANEGQRLAPIRDRFKHVPNNVKLSPPAEYAQHSFSSQKTLVNSPVLHKEISEKYAGDVSPTPSSDDLDCDEKDITPTDVRPSMPASNSFGAISAMTTDIPAYNVFLPTAKPLQLPLLDKYIEDLPKISFAEPETVLGQEERVGWEEWLREADEGYGGFFTKVKRWFGGSKGRYAATANDTEEKELQQSVPSKQSTKRAERSLIFPPMHRIPPQLTVTDLKENRSRKAPIISLNSLMSTGINAVLGAEGSSAAASLIKVEAFRDLMQIIGMGVGYALPGATRTTSTAQLLRDSPDQHTTAKKVILALIPSILGLDFVSAFGKAILWLWFFTFIALIACWEFKIMAGGIGFNRRSRTKHDEKGEGLDIEEIYKQKQLGLPTRIRRSRAYRISIIFLISSLYVPLSKISIGALVWTSDYWAVENYYLTTDNPTPSPFGNNKDQFYDPLDFCYKTTMRKAGFNWAIPILMVAGLTFVIVTVWFPIRLWKVVKEEVPRVDPYTELGEKRKDLKAEYRRLLEKDRSPFAFVYNEYRREWAGFKSAYMALKLVNVLAVTLLTKDNCLFRSKSRSSLDVIRQSTLLGFMFCWMVLQVYARPFADRMSNNSDWCSRIAYVVIAVLGLAAALKLPGKEAYSGWLLVSFTALSFIANGYFALINTDYAQKLVKKWQKRLDFSIDIFSPNLDIAKHIARRIQQETISTLLLAEPEYRIKSKDPLYFGTAAVSTTEGDDEGPPYLLAFQGTQGERHVENLKILREVGLQRYVAAADQQKRSNVEKPSHIQYVQQRILQEFHGPDCYWRPVSNRSTALESYFGRATVLPFPFTIVFRYDVTNTTVTITNESDIVEYLNQNELTEVRYARRVRLALRALEGKRCEWPYQATQDVGKAWKDFFSRRTAIDAPVIHQSGLVVIERNSDFTWRGYNYNSGFNVHLEYQDGRQMRPDGTRKQGIRLRLPGNELGITSNFQFTNTLAKFFQLNRSTLDMSTEQIKDTLEAHRAHFANEAARKVDTLSYNFLVDVYGNDMLDDDALSIALAEETAPSVRGMLANHPAGLHYMQARMRAVNRERLCQWWYVLMDDIWRRNHDSIAELDRYPSDFSPAYRSSICYRPMPRVEFQDFLNQRGLWKDNGRKGFFTHGVLNRIYFYLDEMIFEGTRGGIPVKVGSHKHDVEFHELGTLKAFDPQDSFGRNTVVTYDSGPGTDHDESLNRSRQHFLFEEIYDEKQRLKGQTGGRAVKLALTRASEGVKAWFGLRPLQKRHHSPGLYFSLRENSDVYKAPRGL